MVDLIAAALPNAAFFKADAASTQYGLTPLHFAPSPASLLHKLFTAEQLQAHLAQLKARHGADGGWPVAWAPPGPAAAAEWAGIVALEALRTLHAHGALT